nr:GNAT family N-acetyltransferase [Magnetospirillum sulfuroxidans]
MRQTHRQQVRWGMAHLTIARWRGPADCAMLDQYADLCRRAERIAMPAAALQGLLEHQKAWLDVGAFDGIPVCAQIITRHGDTAYYAAGLTTPGDKRPQSHALIAHAMRQARDDGLRRFHFGFLHVDAGFSAKLNSIALFKRGFTRSFQPVLWHAVYPPA